MNAAGIVMSLLGASIVFACLLALSSVRPDEETPTATLVDIWILGGVITFIRGLFRGLAEAIQNRASLARTVTKILAVGCGLLGIGLALMLASHET